MKPCLCLILLVMTFSGSCAFCSENHFQNENDFQTRLLEMKSKFDSIKDYSCIFEAYSSNGQKSASVTFKYFFRKPKSVRMEILKGKYSGTTLLLQKDNTVKVKPGIFIIGLFTFTYPANHPYVCDLRGNGLYNSDWGYFIDEHIKLLDLTTVRLAGEEELDGRKVLVYELTSKDPAKSRSVAKETIWIDKDQDLLIKYRQYDSSGQLIQSGYYKNIKINSGLKASIFTDF